MENILVRGKKLKLPEFFPDATFGKIRGLGNSELKKLNLNGLVVNTYHLWKEGTIKKIEKARGIHKFMGFNGVIISDSGGFQVMSLIHRNPELGKIKGDKITFLLDGKKLEMTPESCIKMQLKIGSDIVMCLDDCTESEDSLEKQKLSVERTICWAEKCKKEFDKLTKNKKNKPLIFAIIQGGDNKELRKKCADGLKKVGFDGYAFGGWPVKDRILLRETLEYTASLMPDDKIKYCMGVGKPQDIIECVKMSYNLFDCVIPTRDARHKKLYVFENKSKHGVINIKGIHNNSKEKVSELCDCELCRNHTLGDLHRLFIEDKKEAGRLATIHNLTFYRDLMSQLSF